jgi:hypothetical protein
MSKLVVSLGRSGLNESWGVRSQHLTKLRDTQSIGVLLEGRSSSKHLPYPIGWSRILLTVRKLGTDPDILPGLFRWDEFDWREWIPLPGDRRPRAGQGQEGWECWGSRDHREKLPSNHWWKIFMVAGMKRTNRFSFMVAFFLSLSTHHSQPVAKNR